MNQLSDFPSLESYYVVVFQYNAFDHLVCDIFTDISSFHWFQEKYFICHHPTPFNFVWYFWYTYWPPMWYQYVDLSKSWKNEGSTMLSGPMVQKLEEKCFSVKIWIIIIKICLHQQKMNVNDAIFFDILKEQLNSFKTSGNGFWDNKQFSSYKQNFNCHNFEKNSMMSSQKSADESKITKSSGKFLAQS